MVTVFQHLQWKADLRAIWGSCIWLASNLLLLQSTFAILFICWLVRTTPTYFRLTWSPGPECMLSRAYLLLGWKTLTSNIMEWVLDFNTVFIIDFARKNTLNLLLNFLLNVLTALVQHCSLCWCSTCLSATCSPPDTTGGRTWAGAGRAWWPWPRNPQSWAWRSKE